MKKITFFLFFSVLCRQFTNAQDCRLNLVDAPTMQIFPDSTMDSILNQIRQTDSSNTYHILFFRNFGDVNVSNIFYLKIDSTGIAQSSFFKNGLKTVFKRKYNNDLISLDDFKGLTISGNYQGHCKSAVSSHGFSEVIF